MPNGGGEGTGREGEGGSGRLPRKVTSPDTCGDGTALQSGCHKPGPDLCHVHHALLHVEHTAYSESKTPAVTRLISYVYICYIINS